MSLYLDAVPYSQTDSVLGIWLTDMLNQKRYCMALVRKKLACRCGCKGWCTLHAVFLFVKWVIQALSLGVYPAARHDGLPWQRLDNERASRANERMAMRVAILYVRGDWSEYASSLGFPNWNDSLRPCIGCTAYGPDMFVVDDCTMRALRWPENRVGDYDAACKRCEIIVRLTSCGLQQVLAAGLRYDKRANGNRGRVLNNDVPSLGLLADDRLEPSLHLIDVSKLEDLEIPEDGHVQIIFWRVSLETMARHRTPFLDAELGTDPSTCLIVDTLHALYLGVFQVWCRIAIWFLIESGIFGALGTHEEQHASTVLLLRHQLMAWYKARHAAMPTENLTRLTDLTVKMLGSRASPKLKLKGAETWGMMLFLVDRLGLFSARLGQTGRRLKAAGDALVHMVDIWKAHGRVLPSVAQEDCHM